MKREGGRDDDDDGAPLRARAMNGNDDAAPRGDDVEGGGDSRTRTVMVTSTSREIGGERRSATSAACAFVARAQALVAELARLARRAPRAIRDDDGRFARVLFDYGYFDDRHAMEGEVESNAETIELDEELRANYGAVLARYWKAFDACVRWHQDFTRFAEDVVEGMYVSETMETVLSDEDGKQCVMEALAMFGLILKILDESYDWRFRERVVVAHYRARAGREELPNAEEIMALCARTGYDAKTGTRPEGYPETYFARCEMPEWLISMVIGRLRTDDVYNHIPHYPNPEHRSTALAAQGGLLYVILYWAPTLLHRGTSAMREIVDRHYADGWVVACGAGLTADLLTEWEPYEAASMSMKNAVTSKAASELMRNASTSLEELKLAFSTYLAEGVLTEEFVLSNERVLMNVVRDANVILRFCILHSLSSHRAVSSAMSYMPSKEKIVDILLDCAELENELKKIYTSLLNGKQELWEKCKTEAGGRMRELSAYFGGTAGLSRNAKDENLRLWFANLSLEVDKLSSDDPVAAVRTIQELETALTEVEQFHQIVDNIHAKQYLLDSRDYLGKMMMTTNVADSALNTLAVVSDAAYAWRVIEPYTDQLQQRIRNDPFAVRKLRFVFLKLKSTLEMPLLRISQIESPDMYSVSEYYSSQLAHYVRNVVEVVPISMFEILNEIVGVQTNALKELPTKLEKTALKEYAQDAERAKLSKATYEISIFAQGILAMESTFLGVIELDPKQLLEDGIRKQLVKQITETFHDALVFGDGAANGVGWNNFVAAMMKTNPFEDRLNALATKMEGFRRSFEYIQDYVNIYGLQVWQEETSRVVSYHVEQECNGFTRRKQINDWESEFQSTEIPIPDHAPLDAESKNFMGRLLREVLRQTDPKTTRYIGQHSAWFNAEGAEVMGIRTFALLTSAVGNVGLAGLDRLLSFTVTQRLQSCMETYAERLTGELGATIRAADTALRPLGCVSGESTAVYDRVIADTASAWDDMTSTLAVIGQAQLLRRLLNAELVANARIDSHTLSRVLDAANRSALTDIRAHYKSPDTVPYPDESNAIIPKLSAYLAATGMQNPFRQIYCAVVDGEDWATAAFVFTVVALESYRFDDVTSTLVPINRLSTTVDANALIVGLSTFLRQFHVHQTSAYLARLGAFARARVLARPDDAVFAPSIVALCAWSKRFAVVHDVSARSLADFFPPYVLDHAHCVDV